MIVKDIIESVYAVGYIQIIKDNQHGNYGSPILINNVPDNIKKMKVVRFSPYKYKDQNCLEIEVKNKESYENEENNKSFTVTFPISIGTFVIVDHESVDLTQSKALHGRLGTISCYQCVDNKDNDDHIVMVSGYKDSWCGEYLLSELKIATDEQVDNYKKLKGID